MDYLHRKSPKSLWDALSLRSLATNMYFNTWTTNVKLAWGVPRNTRTYLVQTVLAPGSTSTRTDILARYVKFFRSLRNAPSHEVRTASLLVGRDLRSITARNLQLIQKDSGQDPWRASPAWVRECLSAIEMVQIHEQNNWRPAYL